MRGFSQYEYRSIFGSKYLTQFVSEGWCRDAKDWFEFCARVYVKNCRTVGVQKCIETRLLCWRAAAEHRFGNMVVRGRKSADVQSRWTVRGASGGVA